MLLAINEHIIDKASSAVLSENTGTFQNVDLTPTQFAEHIKLGHAFCAQHGNGWRKSENFTVSGVLAVDIDDGLSVQDALDDDFVQDYASILYTTPSHTEEFPRFRIVFELEVSITDKDRMRDALTGLINRFGSDEACGDICHMFYGSTTSEPIMFGNKLPELLVEELIERAKESRNSYWYTGERLEKSNIRSILTLDKDAHIRLESGDTMLLADIPPDTRVYCPKHVDRKASAFTLRSTQGNPGIYCSTCVTTYFLKTSRDVHTYNFDYSWDRILKPSLVEQEDAMYSEDESKVLTISELRGGNIREVNSRYLAYEEAAIATERKYIFPELIDGESKFKQPNPEVGHLLSAYRVTFVKSPKGTGKTEWLGRLVADHKSKDVSILLIGHRRSLISATAKRIGLASYLNDEDEKSGKRTKYNPVEKHYAICVDSLEARMDSRSERYDLILIDEVEQVFSHLLSDTMKENRRKILHTLKFYLDKAKSIYLLDADLNRTTVEIIDSMLTGEVKWQAIVNTWIPDNKEVLLFKNKNHLTGELEASLARGERCFVCSNSKKKIIQIEKGLNAKFGKAKKFRIVTADNVDTEEVKDLIRNIKTKILEYDAIFVSPAMGTGIDITFDLDGQLIDSVFGIFEARINTHFDIDQQLARVRNPKRICVWISPQPFNFETDANAIAAELCEADVGNRIFLGLDDDGNQKYVRDKLYEDVYSNVIAMQRASKNNLNKNYRDLKRHDGWNIIEVEKDKGIAVSGKGVLDFGKALVEQEYMDGILDADPIGPDQYDYLRHKNRFSNAVVVEVAFKMRRFELEAFYGSELDQDMVMRDEGGKLRSSVREYQILYLSDDELRKRAQRDYDYQKYVTDSDSSSQRKILYLALFKAAGIMTDGNQFDVRKVVEKANLDEFIKVCRNNKSKIESLLDIPIRAKLNDNATQQLGAFLRKLGLKLSAPTIQVVNKLKIYRYTLDLDALAQVQSVHEWRCDEEKRKSWTKTLDERDKNFEDPDGWRTSLY
jgi:hypothetical protein